MTTITIWAPSRYRFERLGQFFEEHSTLRRQNIITIQIRHHENLRERLINNISNEITYQRRNSNIQVLVIDDWDLENGFSPDQTAVLVQNLLNLGQVFPKTSIVICDLIGCLFAESRFTHDEIRQLKLKLRQLILLGDIGNVYSNHGEEFDGQERHDNGLLNEQGIIRLTNLIVEDIAHLPVNRF